MTTKKLILLAALISPSLYAGNSSLSIGVKASILGAGIESTYQINSAFSVTGGINGYLIKLSPSSKIIDLDGKVRLLTAGGSIGLHPFRNGFKAIVGLFYNGNQLKVPDIALKRPVTLGGTTFYPQDTSSSLIIRYKKVSPYVGVGFDSPLCDNSPWQFSGEMGILYQGKSKSKLKKSGVLANSESLSGYVRKQSRKTGNRLLLTYLPVFSAGIKYRFCL